MKELLLNLLSRWFSSGELLMIFFALAEDYVKKTDNTMDDTLLEALRNAFIHGQGPKDPQP